MQEETLCVSTVTRQSRPEHKEAVEIPSQGKPRTPSKKGTALARLLSECDLPCRVQYRDPMRNRLARWCWLAVPQGVIQ